MLEYETLVLCCTINSIYIDLMQIQYIFIHTIFVVWKVGLGIGKSANILWAKSKIDLRGII